MRRKYRKLTEIFDKKLKDPSAAADCLSYALESKDFIAFIGSLRQLVRVHGSIKAAADKADLNPYKLYSLFAKKDNDELGTIITLLQALGYELKVVKK